MDKNEKNYIEKPYRIRQILLYLVPLFIVFQIALVVVCIWKQGTNILNHRNWEITTIKFFELLLSILIFILEVQEYQYFRNVYLQKYTIFYCNYISHICTYRIIKLICLLYILYFFGEIMIFLQIFGYFVFLTDESFCDCNFFGAQKQISQFLIFTFYFVGQTVMMYNVYMIYSTLQLFASEHDKINNVGLTNSKIEIMVKADWSLVEIRSKHNLDDYQHQDKPINQNSKEQKKNKKLKCLICFLTIKNQVEYCLLPCKHSYHRQCLEQSEKSQNLTFKCIVCREPFEIDNLESILQAD